MAVDKNKIIAEATKLVQKGALDKAIATYQKILAEDAKDVRVLLKVGELYQKKGDERLAADAFTRVAETYAEQGFFLKAVAVYKQIVKLAPDDVRVNERLAGLYQQLGLMSDAMGQLQHMAAAHEKAGDAGRLTDVLQRMVELDPENIASSIKLGELHARAGRQGPALECLKRAADYLKKHSRTDEYLKVAERIAALQGDDLALTKELANIYLAKGDTKRALAKLQLCFKADPKDVDTLHLLAQDRHQVRRQVNPRQARHQYVQHAHLRAEVPREQRPGIVVVDQTFLGAQDLQDAFVIIPHQRRMFHPGMQQQVGAQVLAVGIVARQHSQVRLARFAGGGDQCDLARARGPRIPVLLEDHVDLLGADAEHAFHVLAQHLGLLRQTQHAVGIRGEVAQLALGICQDQHRLVHRAGVIFRSRRDRRQRTGVL